MTSAAALRGGAVAAGIAADALLGEPPPSWHPVGAFGRAMQSLEDRCYADRRDVGLGYAALGAGAALTGGWLLSRRHKRAALVAATYIAVASKALGAAAESVAVHLRAGDLDAARRKVPALVGRDPSRLDERELARAVVESVAENTVDAVVAPAFWAVASGAPGVLAYRAINTLDAMVGHRSRRYERFGWASARADDVAGWLPARVTVILVMAARPRRARDVWRSVRRDAPGHPSPNAGVAEAAFAAALGLTLGGANSYGGRIEIRPSLGDGVAASVQDIDRARALSRDVTAIGALICAAIAVVGKAAP